MKYILFIFLLFSFYQTQAYLYIQRDFKWYDLKIFKYDLKSKNYDIKFFATDKQTDLKTLLRENNLVSWVNWIFFCPSDYSSCETTTGFTDNERYIKWQKLSNWPDTWYRWVFSLDKDKKPFIFQSYQINQDREKDIYYWLWNFPILLYSWASMIDYYVENELLDSKMKKNMDRNFICSDEKKENLYFWIIWKIKMIDLPDILKELWCFDAINLDAWLSTNLIYNNRYIIWPSYREVLDGIWIEVIWLDTKKLTDKAVKIYDLILSKIIQISPSDEKRIKRNLTKISQVITQYRALIYQKYSKDIYDLNFVWEKDKVWYEIDLNSIKIIEKIYILNHVSDLIKNYLK